MGLGGTCLDYLQVWKTSGRYINKYFKHLPRPFPAYNFVPRGQSQQAVLGMWLVLSLIISTVYRSNLKAMLIKPRLVLPFNNLMELTESGIPCFVVRGTLLHRNIQVGGVDV